MRSCEKIQTLFIFRAICENTAHVNLKYFQDFASGDVATTCPPLHLVIILLLVIRPMRICANANGNDNIVDAFIPAIFFFFNFCGSLFNHCDDFMSIEVFYNL